MSNITNQELNLLRSRPHSTKLWLSIYQPDTVLACQVNDSNISVGDFEITYDNVTGGSYSNIESGMTLLVGSSAGASDKGKIRVRSATASVITAAENYHIDWEDDLYLTVIDFFEIWPIFPRFTESGGIVTWYKDYDILYSSQNEDYGSLIAMGPHRAAFAGDQLYYSATGTANVNDEGIAHSWEFGGGTPSTSSQETPGSVSYPTPGHYTTKLTVSVTGTSRQDISYRHVSIYDRPENGTDNPILRWELNRFIGNREEGGYSVELSVYEDLSSVVDGALVVLFADDIYGTASQSIGGNSPNTPEIVFVGYILGDTIQYDFQSSRVTFEAVSPTEIMKQKEGPIVSLESVTSPSDWYQMQDMDVNKFFYHYLRWHSTLLLTADFRYLSTDYVFQYQDTDPASLYDAINSFMRNSLRGRIVSDRQGLIWAEADPEAIDNPSSSISLGMNILKQDWMGTPEIEEVTHPQTAYLEMGGVAYSGASTGTFDAFLASAPGEFHAYSGGIEEEQGLILTSQSHLNTLVGNVFAYKNAKYPNALLRLSGNYRNLDIAPLERQTLTIFPEDTQKGISFIRKSFHITEMEMRYDSQDETALFDVMLHELTGGFDGSTITIPSVPVENLPVSNPPGFPNFNPVFPPFPDVPLPVLPDSSDLQPWTFTFPENYQNIPDPSDEEDYQKIIDDCCSDVHAGTRSVNIGISGELRSDDWQTSLNNWQTYRSARFPFTILRSSGHDNPTYVTVNGKFETSSDFGQTWSEWNDNTQWRVYATIFTGIFMEAATVIDGSGDSRSKQFSPSGCINLGPGSGFQITLDPCIAESSITGPTAVDNCILNTDGNESTQDLSFVSTRRALAIIDAQHNGSDCPSCSHKVGFVWKIEDAPDPLPDGTLSITMDIKQSESDDPTAPKVKFGVGGADDCNASYTPDISGGTSPVGKGVGIHTLNGQGSIGPFNGGTYYFGIFMESKADWTGEFEILDITWSPDIGNDIPLYSFCKTINRVRIDSVTVHDFCKPSDYL